MGACAPQACTMSNNTKNGPKPSFVYITGKVVGLPGGASKSNEDGDAYFIVSLALDDSSSLATRDELLQLGLLAAASLSSPSARAPKSSMPQGDLTAVGTLPFLPEKGMDIEIHGKLERHAKYGTQLRIINSCRVSDGKHQQRHQIGLWLKQHKLHPGFALRIEQAMGEHAYETILVSPWSLASIKELKISFQVADRIARQMQLSMNSEHRLRAAMRACMTELNQGGNTAVSHLVMARHVARLAGKHPFENLTDKILHNFYRLEGSGFPGARRFDRALFISPPSQAYYEKQITESIKGLVIACKPDERLNQAAAHYISSGSCGFKPDESQKRAIMQSMRYGVSIITGGPGCGKTTITRAIADIAESCGLQVVFCAPTGKAARRSMQSTGRASATLHSRLRLGIEMEGAAATDRRKKGIFLSGDLFLLDESSMADNSLMAKFLSSIPPGARVVLVGDVNQLPSVGAGNAFGDMISCGKLPVARLERVHRTAGDSMIAVHANAIVHGDQAHIRQQAFCDTKGWKWVQAGEPRDIVRAAVHAWQDAAAKYGEEEVQVLVPTWLHSTGATAIGNAIRAVANPVLNENTPAIQAYGEKFHEGDRILFMHNVRDKFSNGETAVLERILTQQERRDYARKGQKGVIAIARMSDKDEHGKVRRVPITRDDFDHINQGYAITVHKSQGSEYSSVIVLSCHQYGFMLNRNLLYTAVTRSKKEVTLIGEKQSVLNAMERLANQRYTGLAHELTDAFLDKNKTALKNARNAENETEKGRPDRAQMPAAAPHENEHQEPLKDSLRTTPVSSAARSDLPFFAGPVRLPRAPNQMRPG